jgi:tRNA pseudouridine38-40 synthase
MRNLKLTIQYDGTEYAGWQSQRNARAIQDVIEDALKAILGEKVRLVGAGRTDAGVHAAGQVANFKTTSPLDAQSIKNALNSTLPDDIRVSRIKDVPRGFNAMLDARSKVYRYTIVTDDILDPLIRNYALRATHDLDLALMRRAARHLIGRHDFTSFQTKGDGKADVVKRVKRIGVKNRGKTIYIEVEADAFLRNMVRNIVGTLMEAGRGKFKPADVRSALLARDRKVAGPTAPAKGLCLVAVNY